MSFFVVTRGDLPMIEARVAAAIAEVPKLLTRALEELGSQTVTALEEATPLGIGRTGGHLADSYSAQVDGETLRVDTSQAEKLNWVRYGTGIYGKEGHAIIPVRARAMWWPEAAHPYASVRGQPPNDFVTPVLDNVEQYIEEALVPFAEQLLLTLKGE